MKELIRFSIKRRFFNHATLLLNILLGILVCGVMFSDQLIEMINPSMLDNQIIYVDLDERVVSLFLEMNQEGITFIRESRNEDLLKNHPKAYLLYYENGYKLESQYKIPDEVIQGIEGLLNHLHQSMTLKEMLTPIEYEIINQKIELENIVKNENLEMNSDKQNLIFMVITSIYFTMLSFSTSVANEVIYEKSTRQLELILTSVSAKTHFLSKMVVGWMTIFMQMGILLLDVITAGMLRILFDEGKGLITLINKLNLFHIEENTFIELFKHLSIEYDFIIQIFFIMIFLMLGILMLQMILVVISSFIANIEEAGNVQGPFYLILLGVYYFALSLNTPYQMSEGIGFFCSFLPFFNMLFMPCRLLIQNVSILELSLSLIISVICMGMILSKGPSIYQRGVLDYTSRGFLGVMKKTLERENEKEK